MERVAPGQLGIVAPGGGTGHHDGGGRPLRAVFAAGDVQPLLGAGVGAVTGLDDDHVMQGAGHFHGDQRRNADGHVGERATVHVDRGAVYGLGLGRLDRVGQNASDTPQVHEFAEGHGLAVLGAGDHLGHALGNLVHRAGEHHNLHELAGRREHDLLRHVALAVVHGGGAQGAARHLGDTRHENRVELAVIDGLLGEGDEQVLGRLDGAHFAAQTPVDELGVGQGSLAAAGGTALGTGCGDAHARLTQHGGRINAALVQSVDQGDGRGGLAFSARCLERRIGGDEHHLAVLARGVRVLGQVLHVAECVDLLDQTVLAGEVFDGGHIKPFCVCVMGRGGGAAVAASSPKNSPLGCFLNGSAPQGGELNTD